ncbi:MAG: response regulator [Bacilli bacterium]|nr:response regulator [Bacilli bacterium]MDD4077952.1 response regulator [Bacilli bacterium]MDD4388599.1 response regulator [Bacilli bacterium]
MDKVVLILRKTNDLSKKIASELLDIYVTDNAIEGLQLIKNTKPILIVIDVMTARICGMDLLKIIRSNPANHHLKIIFTSKNYNYKFLCEAFRLGADYYIKYPLKTEEIEKIYNSIKVLNNYFDLESIARHNDFEWLSEI